MNLFGTRTDKQETAGEKIVLSPLVNIHETDKAVVLEAEMPGLDRESVGLELTGDELVIRGMKKPQSVPEGCTVLLKERSPHEYSRRFVLGNETAREGIEARYENGVLTVTIPKAEEKQPKKIEIIN